MFKKIFTYIQKNASSSNMFSPTTTPTAAGAATAGGGATVAPPLNGHEEGAATRRRIEYEDEAQDSGLLLEEEEDEDEEADEFIMEDDIERQIKTSIIDATKVHAAKAKAMAMTLPLQLPSNLQMDDELADFANAPVTPNDGELDEQFLELDNFPNNEIIVLGETDLLNTSLASDNISEDPLAIDNILDSSSVTTNEEVDTSGDLLWLKLNTESEALSGAAVGGRSVAVPQAKAKTKEDELRDGGSDSGLGSETTRITLKQQSSAVPEPKRSNLKRRLEDNESDAIDLVPDMSGSALSTTSTVAAQKRPKRSINFDNVKIYYFPRQQGFSCVPTIGGCTLGMGARHIAFKTMTLAEHAAELRRAHRSQNQDVQPRGSSSDDTEESEEDFLSEGSGSDADDGSNGFLTTMSPKQRRALLKAAGVRKIDASEKIECRDIRNSREVCGCSCREFCDPETCACSQAGIKCQVDRSMFPCGCSREACGNTVGRVEFNPTRVRTHYIHTVMRLDLEQRQGAQGHIQQQPPQSSSLTYSSVGTGVPSGAVASPTAAASHCYFMQTQSNYSSGYASPAYTPESSLSYYQQQQQQTVVVVSPPILPSNAQQQQQPQSSYAAAYAQLDSLDSGLFATGSNATPSYGELYQSLSYGSAQLTSYQSAYQPLAASPVAVAPSGGFRSCSVPSAPPFGNATTTASSNAQYQTTAASMTAASSISGSSSSSSCNRLSGTTIAASSSSTATVATAAAASATATTNDFINLNAPLASSSRLSQINDLLQHNRNTTAALVAVSEGYSGVRTNSTSSTIDSIDTPPIVEDTQRSCMSFEALPPPLVNPTPIVAVVQSKMPTIAAINPPRTAPQPRQPLDVQSLNENA
ncbi:cysteine/serine-rich nuclear protein 1 [Drosophila guanche]|uniref:Blast:Cysteine/serine-rich nuclear protein 2 n=1 Tax=Drosophila guanche TaxID=7266 RepID=A0A3B0JW95_DROGU|nr:cysteine/serine-rich nuclear protein 1 [Drosophila guanche]SPP79770.1 blast:Cysteine/serine-rich nuclear protein 2 [Drosophila guanche]